MPSYMYWPSDVAKIIYRPSAFKNGVSKADIEDILALHPSEVRRYKGRPTIWDEVYSGGIRIVRPTMAVAEVSGGCLLEIGFRQDLRKPHEECSVFHARYL